MPVDILCTNLYSHSNSKVPTVILSSSPRSNLTFHLITARSAVNAILPSLQLQFLVQFQQWLHHICKIAELLKNAK